jgi:hypothetical protein
MKEKISRICLIVYAVLFIFTAFCPTTAGGSVGLYCILVVFAIPPIVAGPKRYRILGMIALLIAIIAVAFDYNAGKRRHEMLQKRNEAQKQQEEKAGPINKP